jgi:protein unc-13
MSENVHRIADGGSGTMAPAMAHHYDANVDYVINEYMKRLGTRLNILETELKYAWRALDLLSQEYIKMWERLEKLEGLLYEQQSVISQLLDFYTSGGAGCRPNMGAGAAAVLDSRLGELEVIREILGNGTVEDGLEEGLDVTRAQPTTIQELELDEMHVPDEAFYRSLNQAYREDLVGCDLSAQGTQLGMIWEEREDTDENNEKKNELKNLEHLDESEEVFSALDYKDYRGNSPCVSEQDIAQLSRIDSIDHVAMEKLNELDRLSSKLQQDSDNIKQLQRKLLESPLSMSQEDEGKSMDDNAKSLDEHLRQMYNESENWSFSSSSRDQDELLLLAKSELPNSIPYSTRPSSRLSVTDSVIGTDNEVAEVLAGGMRTPTSPRRRQLETTTCSAPFTTVTGRLAYSAAVQHVDAAAAANSKNPFYCGNSLIAASYETVPCSTPNIFNIKSERAPSPSLSVCSVRTRQDGYLANTTNSDEVQTKDSPSPPPPAPLDVCESFLMSGGNATSVSHTGPSPVFLGTDGVPSSSINLDPKRSPKTSPKRSKTNIVAAKSDSGLSSMSGWSSIEKSPGSPKNLTSKVAALNYFIDPVTRQPSNRTASPVPVQASLDNRPYLESNTDSLITSHNNILPGGHHLSAFTTVKSPCSLETSEGYGTFVPAPAPASDINVSPRRKSKHHTTTNANTFGGEFMYRNDQPAIYSVAGSNRETYTSVYTSNSADYITQTINYPDLIEPYENNEFHNMQRQFSYNSLTTTQPPPEPGPGRRKSLSRMYSTSNGQDGIANHEGYKTAMYRTMFPSGNITDALSYYPTSSRYESGVVNLPQADYNDPSAWLSRPPQDIQYQDSTSPSSSMRSVEASEGGYNQSPYLDQRRHQQRHQQQQQQQPIYENQAQIDQHNRQWNQRQEIPYLELDLRNRNVPEYVVQQQQHGDNKYFDPSTVIITQSGYITITSDTVDTSRDEKTKKTKRGNTLKSAMSSVSHWLPDLHLTKRHRSYSLPSGVRREDLEKSKSNHVKSNVSSRKKKKNAIVSTVSGILQKAKRKTYFQHHTQSLSDPEQSENEWVLQRASSVVSEDDRSEDSYSMFENQPERDLFAKVAKPKIRKNSQQEVIPQKVEEEQLQPQFEQIKVSPQTSEVSPSSRIEHDIDGEAAGGEEEISGKSTGSGSSSIFPMIGDTKKSSASSEKSDETVITESKMVVVVGGASMEFAVSRALGKYRQQKQTSSFSDDQLSIDEQGMVIEEMAYEEPKEPQENKNERLIEQISTESQNSETSKVVSNGEFTIEGSPSASSLRTQVNRYLPRHQQSLEIPGHKGEDDDSKSTHSWRSTSRVSSRRQSTEDSIDSEDEWYCYELRKLEEMERQSQLEAEMGATLREEPELEEFYEPYEEVKERMSFVLRELRMKAKVVEGVLEEKDNNLHVIQSAKHRENDRNSLHLEEAHALFNKIRDFKDELQEEEESPREPSPEPKDEEHSSGETSGPDSPHLSVDEEEDVTDAFARCHVPAKEKPEEVPLEEPEPEKVEEATPLPKIQVDTDDAKPEPSKEATAQMGSKWKLLKALKERKAEEKSSQVKVPETTTEKDKVSMLGMMQKFYEIHVKT